MRLPHVLGAGAAALAAAALAVSAHAAEITGAGSTFVYLTVSTIHKPASLSLCRPVCA